jgi:hypothetical protein
MRKYTLLFLFFCLVSFYSLAQEIAGKKIYGAPVIQSTTAELMQHWVNHWPPEFKKRNSALGLEEPNRENLPQAPGALELSQWPPLESRPEKFPNAPQVLGISFTGATLPDAGAFPPDVMGAAGPTQFVVFLNGRLRTFNKTTGVADGVINADPDAFFSLITTPPGAGEITFTSDPNVRYDRLSGRWFLTIIDVTLNTTSGAITKPNRLLIAMSDGPNITSGTVWFFTWLQNSVSDFADYPSLGIDANALYIGTNQFTLAGSFINTNAYILDKSSIIGGAPTGTVFTNLLNGSVGPFAPRGVDNYDPNNTGSSAIGYFIGVDNYVFGVLSLLRITDPVGTPSGTIISISLLPLTTSFPIKVRHSGNTGGSSGYLDALDDRLYAAHLRNGSLWTAHNIGVNSSGLTTTRNRNAARWYEIQNLNTSPTVFQMGTLYDNTSPNNTSQRNYWIPSIMVSGQGHAALGCSIAGTSERINAFTTGRLVGDTPGALRDGPGGATIPGYTSSATAYNPSGDPGGSGGRRWGDYSYTSLDPNDDMTMWTAQEFCSSSNTWGVRVVQLLAPPPVTPAIPTPSAVGPNEVSVNVIITGVSVNGSGFFDPGTGFLNRISASLPGGIVVNSVTYNSPTQVTLNLNTTGVADGFYDVTITNPDGQSATGIGILEIDSAVPVELVEFVANIIHGNKVLLNWRTATEVNNYGFEVERSEFNVQSSDWKKITFVEGHGNTNSPKEYSFIDDNVLSAKYAYRLKQIDNDGTFEYSKVIEVDMNAPVEYELSQNYPNPFNPVTTIKFNISKAAFVKLSFYNILGELKGTIVNEFKEAGIHTVNFNASELNSGIYVYMLEVDDFVEMRKMSLIK